MNELQRAVEQLRNPNANGNAAKQSSTSALKESLISKPVLVRLDTVESKPITWLWPGRIAIGKLTILSGDPGLGKSLLTVDLSAAGFVGFPVAGFAGTCALGRRGHAFGGR